MKEFQARYGLNIASCQPGVALDRATAFSQYGHAPPHVFILALCTMKAYTPPMPPLLFPHKEQEIGPALCSMRALFVLANGVADS
jgi:hypothetical protein